MMVGTENLKRILDQICRDKGIDRSLLISAIEDAVSAAVRKKYGSRREIEVQFNDELGEVESSGGGVVNTDSWEILVRFGRDVLRNGMDPLSNQQSITSGILVIGLPHTGQVR